MRLMLRFAPIWIFGLVLADGSFKGYAVQSVALPTQSHQVEQPVARMLEVAPNVALEVLDWGGTGRPLVLLAGLGDTAHAFDSFAPKLTANYHVYGITRRGFGVSSKPAFTTENYTAARLGDDVLAVCSTLHLKRPVLVGHSLAGEEMSYIGYHHPEAVAALIYLDAGYSYALYDQTHGQIMLDSEKLRNMLPEIVPGRIPADVPKSLNGILDQLRLVEKEIVEYLRLLPDAPSNQAARPEPPPYLYPIFSGQEEFPTVCVPALVIFAVPHDFGPPDPSEARKQLEVRDLRNTENQINAFTQQVPLAHIVRIPHASHYVYRSNEGQVLREINAFVATIPN